MAYYTLRIGGANIGIILKMQTPSISFCRDNTSLLRNRMYKYNC